MIVYCTASLEAGTVCLFVSFVCLFVCLFLLFVFFCLFGRCGLLVLFVCLSGFFWLFVFCLSVVIYPTREYFAHMETWSLRNLCLQMLGIHSLKPGRDLCRATSAVTRDIGFLRVRPRVRPKFVSLYKQGVLRTSNTWIRSYMYTQLKLYDITFIMTQKSHRAYSLNESGRIRRRFGRNVGI